MTKEEHVKKKSVKPSNPVRMDFDRMAAIFAVALSIAAILVSLVEVQTARTQQKTSAWPYLEISGSYQDSGFSFYVENKGVGPAIVGDFSLLNKDNRPRDLDALIIETLGEEDAFSYEVYKATDPSGSVLAKGEKVTLFQVPWQPNTQKLVQQWDDTVNIEACYCSIYGDCWSTTLRGGVAPNKKQCGISKDKMP
jgi:hypothetical protein